jgi:hypothetical protein
VLALCALLLAPLDAPIHIVVRPGQLAEQAALLNLAVRTEPALAAAEDRLRDAVGFDPLRRDEWVRIGVDPEQPVTIALAGTRPGELAALARALAAGRPASAALHHQVVARVADPVRFARFARRQLLHVRRQADLTIIDIATPLGPGRPPAAAALDDRFGERGAARLLREGALSVHVALAQLPALDYALGLGRVAEAAAAAPTKGRAQIVRQGLSEATACREDWTKTPAVLDDFALSADFHGARWDIHAGWGVSALGQLGLATAVDDGVLGPIANGALGRAEVHLPSLSALERLPHGGVLRDPVTAAARVSRCGPVAAWLLGLGRWPELLGSALENLGQDSQLRPMLSSARNLALLIQEADADHFVGALAVSIDGLPAGFPGEACGQRIVRKGALRQLELCSAPLRTPGQIAIEPLAAGRHAIAWLPDQRSLDAWLLRPRGTPRAQPESILELELDLARAVAAATKRSDPTARALAGAFAHSRTRLTGRLYPQDGLLRLDLRVDSGR